jgi:transcriptional regulator GlxA family with amidase domain
MRVAIALFEGFAVLDAAGLLRGRAAAAHWPAADQSADWGAWAGGASSTAST